ncbi:MAG: AtpZ/AtpI family protein [Chloroflexi bacterium]|nr:AtpZ/AtpI family protein [Chloroflexota bacterium]MDA1271339.1 AtpZ/AtpI family protein [Chloroflexota bacterium]PKB59338.1 MAG: hypothetical protein BZY83_02330 [SAR202 cluster bacterium Casp-Chloro-G2]
MERRLLALRLTGLGWYVATCIVVGVVGGVALDKWLGFKPLFTLLGILLGTTAAFYGLFKMIQPLIQPAAPAGKSSASQDKPGDGAPPNGEKPQSTDSNDDRNDDGGNP